MASLRQRKRRAAMRLTQRTGLELFQQRGFDAVTVADVAAEVDLAPSTIYRHFETKEAIVLWDEHQAEIDQAFEDHLRAGPPLMAIRDALVASIGVRYEDPFQLERVQYVYATEQLHAAAAEQDYRDRDELAAGLRQVLSPSQRDAAPLLAGSSLLALDVALDRWQAGNGRPRLATAIRSAFDRLAHLADIT